MNRLEGYGEWSAFDGASRHPMKAAAAPTACRNDDEGVFSNLDQAELVEQASKELIVIRNSANIDVRTTDTQVALSLQAALQVAIALVINLTILDSSRAEKVTQDLLQLTQLRQSNKQSIVIENSCDVEVRTEDTDIVLSIQLLLQILLTIVVVLDIL
ncbi:hypothetical protein Q73_07025 [Bacillus coahuilensis m2-6]|uniref:Spore coat protein X/V domain-containing protein n=1 Tax=Bacillus coahuilensis p1.1.43 TaxID=1150625 RepID=A0A147K868_9BACI|nr:spore coat protein [Bacillus coahuilensis]KUP06390.1 hypothetical protein Q75_07550 [Bacillus coahuilensis p1.1.43]KUP08260.1 hypothetical protein Q73_07025 [Bacillus coahuilensis m2-6]